MKNYQLSPGGCGSCALEDFFGKAINYPRESWNAHERNFTKPEAGSKVAYIFADPCNIVLSYFRRGFLNAPYYHCRHIDGDVNSLSQKNSWGIADYFLLMDTDPFKLRDHFFGWYNNKNRDYDIMFIRYETLNDNLEELCKWYSFDTEKCKNFTFKQRNSDWKTSTEFVQLHLERLYGDFRNELLQLPDVIINP